MIRSQRKRLQKQIQRGLYDSNNRQQNQQQQQQQQRQQQQTSSRIMRRNIKSNGGGGMGSLGASLCAAVQYFVSVVRKVLYKLWQALASHFGGGGTVVALDTGKRVRVGKQIAEGGFSFVFLCTPAEGTSQEEQPRQDDDDCDEEQGNGGGDGVDGRQREYALKRIMCCEPEVLEGCRREAAVHRSVERHPNVMPLLGMTVTSEGNDSSTSSICYMLFPYYPHSLRAEVNRRCWPSGNIDGGSNDSTKGNRRMIPVKQHQQGSSAPWKESEALELFLGIVRGVQALHRANYSHRDVKLENVLLRRRYNTRKTTNADDAYSYQPVLMDFGSAGPLIQAVQTRKQVLTLEEEASQHTTVSYRPPELFPGGVRTGDDDVDFTAVDVWSLGCTLHAILYGASPSECEFVSNNSGNNRHHLRIVECTHVKVLSGLPAIPAQNVAKQWYSDAVKGLMGQMLTQDRSRRPTLDVVLAQVEALIHQQQQ